MVKNTLIAAAVVLGLVGVFLPMGSERTTIVEKLGAVNSPDLSIGAFRVMSAGRDSFTQATNTAICTLQSPAGTSTLIHAGVQVTGATSSITSLSMSRSTQPAVIGNLLASTSLAAGTYRSMDLPATTTIGGASTGGGYVFSPNTYLVVAQTGGGILNQTGSCEALWQVF